MLMATRIIFVLIALLILAAGMCAYHHDRKLERSAEMVNLGDPNETVRELLGDPTREGECGSLTVAPKACADEYLYRFYFSIFRPEYEIVWFDRAGKVLGEQHFHRP